MSPFQSPHYCKEKPWQSRKAIDDQQFQAPTAFLYIQICV